MPTPRDVPGRRPRLVGGNWWRFSGYDVRDGTICPSKQAKPEPYNPWSAYYVSRQDRGTNEPPYQGLLRLVRDCAIRPGTNGRKYSLDQRSEGYLCDWCAANGLLGILIFRTLSVALAPRWWRPSTKEDLRQAGIPEEYDDQFPEEYIPKGALVPSQIRYISSSSMWWERIRTIDRTRLVAPGKDEREHLGDLVPAESIPAYWPPTVAVLRDLRGRNLREEPLSKTLARFFVGVQREDAETYLYPRPVTKEFAQQYCEPVDDFLEAAFLFRDLADSLVLRKALGDMDKAETDRMFSAKMALEALIAPVSRAFDFKTDGTFEDYLASPSLLSSFAMMLLDDLTGRRLSRCRSCGMIFASSAYQADYCSATCQRREAKRRWRAGGGGKPKQARSRQTRIDHGKPRSE